MIIKKIDKYIYYYINLNNNIKMTTRVKTNVRLMNDIKDLTLSLKSQDKTILDVNINESLNGPHYVLIKGPKDTPFELGKFKLSIKLPNNYPFEPPTIRFETPIYHPNISNEGYICLDILKDQWSSVLKISKVLLCISALMANANPDDPLMPEIANQYRNNIEAYKIKATQHVNNFALNTTL